MKREEVVRLRPVTMWAVHYGNGYIDSHAVRRTRAEAIAAFCNDPAAPGWDYWRRKGCKPVKVRLVAAPDGECLLPGGGV